jgi:hypothetical protein
MVDGPSQIIHNKQKVKPVNLILITGLAFLLWTIDHGL